MKKLVKYLALALLAVWVVQDPTGAAALVGHVLAWFAQAGHSLSALASHIH